MKGKKIEREREEVERDRGGLRGRKREGEREEGDRKLASPRLTDTHMLRNSL